MSVKNFGRTGVDTSESVSRASLGGLMSNSYRAADYEVLYETISAAAVANSKIKFGCIGTTVCGRPIPVVTIGKNNNSRAVLYVGGLDGADILSPSILLRFILDYTEQIETERRLYNVNLGYLYENRTVHIIPMLNPDGYHIRRNGADGELLRERLISQNGGDDFSKWRFNARGADLSDSFRENVNAEPERETAALCNYIRYFDEIGMVIRLHADGDALRYSSGEKCPPRSRALGRLLARMIGCRLADPEEITAGGATGYGPADWFIDSFDKPAYDCGCDFPEIDKQQSGDTFRAYCAVREALVSAPLLL